MPTKTTIFTGGTVLVDPTPGAHEAVMSDALAMRDGAVVALGEAARALIAGPEAEVIDLEGGVLAPAVGEGHAHPLLGGIETLGPRVRAAENLQGILDAVREWKQTHPDDEWIIGASYDATFAAGGLFDAEWLDEVTGDTPTILRAWDYHTAWVNTAALKAGGITAETPDPPLGRYVRRADGSPLGTLQETAANNFLAEVVPAYPLEQRVGALEHATRVYAKQGTTWVQDAWVDPENIEVYLAAAKADRLHTRINMAFRADPARWREQVAEFVSARTEVRALGHERLSAETIKFFLDGVVESHTAALLDPYADRPDERGILNWAEDELQLALRAFAEAGFQLHLHAIGDAANRSALDGLETIADLSDPARPHVIAHVAVLHPDDIARFAELGVIANFEPYWAQCDAVMRDLTIPHLGHDREGWQYLIGSVLESGATVSFGSDWPVTTEDWRPALATAIDRRDASDATTTAWLPHERVAPRAAFSGYTTGIAKQALAPDRGTLRVGQTADLMWVSANPVEITAAQLTELQVHGTWLAGTRTH